MEQDSQRINELELKRIQDERDNKAKSQRLELQEEWRRSQKIRDMKMTMRNPAFLNEMLSTPDRALARFDVHQTAQTHRTVLTNKHTKLERLSNMITERN